MDWIKLLMRVTFGGFMLFNHGLGKLDKLSQVPIKFPDPLGVGSTVSLYLTLFGEVVCAGLLILGVFTRFASLPLIITMLVATFIVHSADPFLEREMAVLYLVAFTTTAYLDSGKFSLDYFIRKKK